MDVALFPVADFLGGGLYFAAEEAADEVLTRFAAWAPGNPG